MKTATVSAFRLHLSDYLNQSEPVVVTQSGQPKALLLPVTSEDDLERLLMANSSELSQLLEEADRRISRTGGIPHDEFWMRVHRNTETKTATPKKRNRKGG